MTNVPDPQRCTFQPKSHPCDITSVLLKTLQLQVRQISPVASAWQNSAVERHQLIIQHQ
jgi:hypothetical protein